MRRLLRAAFGMAFALLTACPAGDDSPTSPAELRDTATPSDDAKPVPPGVRHLTQHGDAISAYDGLLTQLQLPPDTLRVRVPLEGFMGKSGGEFRSGALPWPCADGTPVVVTNDEQALEQVQSLRKLRETGRFAFVQAKERVRLISRPNDGTAQKIGRRLPEPWHLQLGQGQWARVHWLLPDPEARLSLRAKMGEDGPAVVRIECDGEVLARLEVRSEEWTVLRETITFPDQRVRIDVVAEAADGREVPADADLVRLDWMEVDTGTTSVVVARTNAESLQVEYTPRVPRYREAVARASRDHREGWMLCLGGPTVLEVPDDASRVTFGEKTYQRASFPDGVLRLDDVERGLHPVSWDAGDVVLVTQEHDRYLSLLADDRFSLPDSSGEAAPAPWLPPHHVQRILRRFEVGGDRRPCFWMPAPSSMRVRCTLAEGDRLAWALGAHGYGGGRWDHAITLRISWLNAEVDEPALVTELQWCPPDHAWDDRCVDLGDCLPGYGELIFEVEGSEQDFGRLFALGDPRLVPADPPRRPNVVLYLVDTLRSENLGCYGGEHPTSPRLDALAAEGYLFERSYAVASWTRPSVASILTGDYPEFHGAENEGLALSPSVTTIAERLQAQEYSCWAFVSNVQVHGERLRFEQGFHRFVTGEGFENSTPHLPTLSSSRIRDTVEPWLQEHGDEPFFLYIHTLDPHSPYDPPEKERFVEAYDGMLRDVPLTPKLTFGSLEQEPTTEDAAYVEDVYDAAIRYQDDRLGELLDFLDAEGLRDDTVVLVLSDHGEEFLEHGGWEHGGRLWEELVRVPLVAWIPPSLVEQHGLQPPGQRLTDPVVHVDLVPSLCELLQLNAKGPWQGESVLPLLRGEAPTRRDLYIKERSNLGALIDGPWKWVWLDAEGRGYGKLFHLEDDPGETVDRALDEPARVERMKQRVIELEAGLRERFEAHQRSNVTMSDAELDRLRKLGYVPEEDEEAAPYKPPSAGTDDA